MPASRVPAPQKAMNRRDPLKHPLIAFGLTSACLAGLWAAPAYAAGDDSGWYAGGAIGFDAPSSQTFSSSSNSVTNGYSVGFAGGVDGGYEFGNGLRPDVEFRYQHAGIDSISVTVPTGNQSTAGQSSGSIAATTLLANVFYDFRQSDGVFAMIHPYGGLGVGMARLSINNESYHSFSGESGAASGSATALAYQLGFGVSSDLGSALAASFDVRYLMTTNARIGGGEAAAGSGGESGLDGKYRAASVMFGLKYKFGRIS
jgi:opacity protein-like surface antigen